MNIIRCFHGVVLASGLISLGACSLQEAKYSLARTGEPGAAKPPDCAFVMATTKLDRDYTEIAILDSEITAVDATNFKQAVQKQVCELGGDAVIAQINGNGYYVRGTVVRWKEAPAQTAAAAEPVGEPSPAPPAPDPVPDLTPAPAP